MSGFPEKEWDEPISGRQRPLRRSVGSRMNGRAFIAMGVGLPYLACSILPIMVFGVLYDQWGTNLIWGPVFGFGWWIAQGIGGIERWETAARIGVFVWPPVVLAGLFLLGRSVWRSGSERRRRLFLMLIAISCLPIVPAKTALSLHANARVPVDFNVLAASW